MMREREVSESPTFAVVFFFEELIRMILQLAYIFLERKKLQKQE